MMEQSHALEPVALSPVNRRRRLRRNRRWFVLSLCLLLLTGGAGILIRMHSAARVPTARVAARSRRFKNDVQPGGNKAILTLSDGSSIVLDSAGNGTLSMQGNTRVLKLASGKLAYEKAHGADAGPVYNTISTPRGGQYQIELPDGSKVWLDAGSSLRFPTAFAGREREVQLTGEAFFEVSGDARRPFLVSVFSHEPGKSEELQKVRVLGTQFNVMAYADEKLVKTTLINGGVRIDDAALGSSSQSSFQLRPGEQAQLNKNHSPAIQVVNDVDVDAAVAWKNGYFDFNKADIQTIMRQLSRWYDIEVSFRGNRGGDQVFFGGIQRDLPLSSIFKILERSGVLFSIDGKKVVVDL
jgi:ferric-dicitrate binding protein FerR (iron transport regulator)